MRTTTELPEDLHRTLRALARDRDETLSQAIAEILRRGLGDGVAASVGTSKLTGLPVVRLGRAITTEDVRALDDDT